MASMTLTYGAASLSAALCAAAVVLRERFGVSPIPAMQGTSVPFAGHAAHAAQTKNVVDRKADGWVPPRGRRL
jgi:hypothetical protein